MPYSKESDISQFAGLAQFTSGENLWVVDAKKLARRADAITWWTATNTYKNVKKDVLNLIARAQRLIESPFKKNQVVNSLNSTYKTIPVWEKEGVSKDKVGHRIYRAINRQIEFLQGRIIIQQVVTEKIIPRIIEREKIVYVEKKVPMAPAPARLPPYSPPSPRVQVIKKELPKSLLYGGIAVGVGLLAIALRRK